MVITGAMQGTSKKFKRTQDYMHFLKNAGAGN